MEVKYCALHALLLMATAAAVAGEMEDLPQSCVSHNMEPELYQAYHQALEEAFNNTDTLYYLQRAFYPPSSPPAGVVKLSVATVVNNIVDSSWPDDSSSYCNPAFTNDTWGYPHRSPAPPWVRGRYVNYGRDDHCYNCDVLQWSKDTDTGSHVLVTSINGLIPLLSAFQLSICSILSIYIGTGEFAVHTDPKTLNLTIAELSKMPADYELREALTSALTWVSHTHKLQIYTVYKKH